MPGCSGGPVVITLVCFFTFAREAAGALSARHSPRPLGPKIYAKTGRNAPRERGCMPQRGRPHSHGGRGMIEQPTGLDCPPANKCAPSKSCSMKNDQILSAISEFCRQ